ncbi:probable transmembrane reductase CYB561D1 [Protopterus annectens]|uniref:probable transmembrane reductase CYB561D1 n=1 Tax=Protopterus annectens TaxID=7888 RepID=UPI001CFA3549|nr:probable transmembrane reductase CYB561D1 [Protopterus annectens]
MSPPAVSSVPYTLLATGEGLGMSDFWLYGWLRRAAAMIAHLVVIAFTVFLLVMSRPGSSLFSWHPVCMSLAFCLGMTEGILLFSHESSPLCLWSHKTKVRLHWILQALVLTAAITGLVLIVSNKNLTEQPHLVSWHSVLGIVTLAATCGQGLYGLLLLFPGLIKNCSAARLKLYHATSGLLCYMLATVTVVLAMYSGWFQAQINGTAWYICVVAPFYPALVVMNQITSAYLPRRKVDI